MNTWLQEYAHLKNITGITLETVRSKTRGDVAEIMSLTSYRDNQYEWLIGDSENGQAIKRMVEEHPYIWQNIKFKFKGYINKMKQEAWQEQNQRVHAILAEELVEEIVKIFMKPSEHNPFFTKDKKEILAIIDAEIINNESLSTYIGGHSINSFIEYSNTKLKNLSERKDWGGFWLLIKNISGRILKTGESEIRHFNKTFKEMIGYANRIFHIDIYTSLPGLRSIQSFANFDMVGTMLRDAMKSWGTSYRDATFFIKALYAWSDIPGIKYAHKEALSAQGDFFRFLNSPDGKCTEEFTGQSKIAKKPVIAGQETIHRKFIYTFTFENGEKKDIKITTRVKSVESIVIKLFADEHYGNIDALNDLLGIRMFLGELSAEQKIQVIHHFWKFMGRNSAIFKNKGYLDDTQFTLLKERWKVLNSTPIGIESRIKNRSSLEYKDCKYSGYLRQDIHKNQIGTEIQFFDREDEPNPKGAAHHSILDAKKIIQWWYRGAHIITGKQISKVIQLRCFRADNPWLTFEEIFGEICTTLVPYVLPKADPTKAVEIAFAVRWYEEIIQEEFPSMEPLHKDYHHLLGAYIWQLKEEYDVGLIQGE